MLSLAKSVRKKWQYPQVLPPGYTGRKKPVVY